MFTVPKSGTSIFLCLMLLGCGPSPEQLADADACVKAVDGYIDGLNTLKAESAKKNGKEFSLLSEDCTPAYDKRLSELQSLKKDLLQKSGSPFTKAVEGLMCSGVKRNNLIDLYDNKACVSHSQAPIQPQLSYEDSVKKAWEDAEKANRSADQALDEILDDYDKKSISHQISSGSGPRIDTFTFKDRPAIICVTTVRNGIRAMRC